MTYSAKYLVVIVALTVACGNAQAVTVMGAHSCGDWLKFKPVNREKEWPRMVAEAWLVGYLSGAASGQDKDALKNTTASSLFVWMDNYCQSNPLDNIADGGNKLYFELLERKGL